MVRPALASADGSFSVNLGILPKMLDILKPKPPPHDVERRCFSHQAVFCSERAPLLAKLNQIHCSKVHERQERTTAIVVRSRYPIGIFLLESCFLLAPLSSLASLGMNESSEQRWLLSRAPG